MPTETPACPPVTGLFASIWEANQDRLGCAINEVHETWLAGEHFEGGQMFWREDVDVILVLYQSGYWSAFMDIWQESDPEFSCLDIAPAESPPTPKRGFGKIWCTYGDVRAGLGWATDAETGYYGMVQDFTNGTILQIIDGGTYILFGDSTWTRW
jgi:hypothetical protein